ncbi:hypothetical protein [Frankia sp. QA3]|uniref:hypothetical protein n=1 Tax=Frankia sp. QA3 TaxID=710111 RepID=UPI000269C8DF|nr:hypothetical protein [Frankia sp. QA3]EIV94888.1 hypothetical protein FraQA3DRAFT_4675 [Frankia sp. QA3]
MSPETWRFVDGKYGSLSIDPEGFFDDGRLFALRDWLQGDIGYSFRSLSRFRDDWSRVRRGEFEGTAGNVTEQTLVGDEVLFESLYDRWDDVRIPLAEIDEILEKYAAYLQEKAKRRDAVDGAT